MENEKYIINELKQIKQMCRILSLDIENEQKNESNVENKKSLKLFPEYIQDTIDNLYTTMKVTRKGV